MSRYFEDTYKMSTEVCYTWFYDRKQAKTFSSLQRLHFFFQKFVFWTTSQVLKKWSNNFHSNCQKTLGTNINCSRRFVTTNNTMKDQPRTFVTKRKANFWKISCYRPLRSQRRNIINYKKSVKQTLWTLHKCLLTFLMFDKSRKKGAKSFLHWKDCLFFSKKMCFQQPHKSWWNDHSFGKVIVTIASVLIETVTWGLSHSIFREKTGAIIFAHWKGCLVFKNLCFEQPHMSWRNDLITSTVLDKKPCGQL